MNVLELVKRYTPVALLLVLAALCALVWHYASRAHELERVIEQHNQENALAADPALANAGVVVERTVSQEVLEKTVRALAKENASIAEQLAAAKSAAGKMRVAAVTHAETKPGPVTGTPIAQDPSKPSPPCLVDAESKMVLKLDGVDLITDKGVRLHLLSLSAWRTYPLPETKLFEDGVAIPASMSIGGGDHPIAPSDRKLSLTLRAGWAPDDLRARPELALALGYRLLNLGPVSLSPYAEVEQRYSVNNSYDLHATAGAELKLEVK